MDEMIILKIDIYCHHHHLRSQNNEDSGSVHSAEFS
jgi:hypothetical protein